MESHNHFSTDTSTPSIISEEEEANSHLKARIDAQLELLAKRPQVLNDHLSILSYDGGQAGLGYEIDNILEFSEKPIHRSSQDSVNSTLVLRCQQALNLDYCRICTSSHLDYAVRSGVIWLYGSSHGIPRMKDRARAEYFVNCDTEQKFDAVCAELENERNAENITVQPEGHQCCEDPPDCFYFETDPVTLTTTIALRNRNRIKDMDAYIRRVFVEIDVNGDGELSMNELVPPLVKMGYSARFARKIVRDADDDGNGVIDVEEFTAHMSKLDGISSSSDLFDTEYIRILFTSVHTKGQMKAIGTKDADVGDAFTPEEGKSFVDKLVKLQGNTVVNPQVHKVGNDNAQPNSEGKKFDGNQPAIEQGKKIASSFQNHENIVQGERQSLSFETGIRSKDKKTTSLPYFQCTYMCFCGHTRSPIPIVADPDPLFDHEFFKPRHLRRPFADIAPPKMSPMPAPGPQVLPTLNIFDNDYIAHLNKSACVIVFTAHADQMLSGVARRTVAQIAREFNDPSYPRQEMTRPSAQEIADGALTYRPPRFIPQDLRFFEVNETHTIAPALKAMFQIITAPRILITYSMPWRRHLCFTLQGAANDPAAFSDTSVRHFLHSFCDGSLMASEKTEAFLIDNPMGMLRPIHSQAFKTIVLNPTKDVIVYFYSSMSNKSMGDMEQVAELLGVNFDLHITCMNLDENDIPLYLIEEAQMRWQKDHAAARSFHALEGKFSRSISKKKSNRTVLQKDQSTFIQRTGIALYKRGRSNKCCPIWKRGVTNIKSIINFARMNCTVPFDFSPNSYFRLKFDEIKFRDNLVAEAKALLSQRNEDSNFLMQIAERSNISASHRAVHMPKYQRQSNEVSHNSASTKRILQKVVNNALSASRKLATDLEVQIKIFEENNSQILSKERKRINSLVKLKTPFTADNSARVGVHSNYYQKPIKIAQLKKALETSLRPLLLEAQYRRNREVSELFSGRAWLQACKIVGKRPIVGLFIRKNCEVCDIVREQFLDLSLEFTPEIKFVMLKIDGDGKSLASSRGREHTNSKPVGDMFPMLDEMLLETPAFALYHRQTCVERFTGADMDRLQRQLHRLRALFKYEVAEDICGRIMKEFMNLHLKKSLQMADLLRGISLDEVHASEAIKAHANTGFTPMTMEYTHNLSCLVPELIAKGVNNLQTLCEKAFESGKHDEDLWLVKHFYILRPSATMPKGSDSYLSRLKETLQRWRIKEMDSENL